MADKDGVTVPGWFIKLMTTAVVLASPWAAWVTISLTEIGVKVKAIETLGDDIRSLRDGIHQVERRVDKIEERVSRSERNKHQGG